MSKYLHINQEDIKPLKDVMTNEEHDNPILATLAEKKFISEIEVKYCHVR